MHHFLVGHEGRTVMLAGGKRQSLVQYTQATGGREPQICFNQLWGVHIEVVAVSLLNSVLYFHLAAVTRVTQKLCFCVLTELDVAEEKKVERKTD